MTAQSRWFVARVGVAVILACLALWLFLRGSAALLVVDEPAGNAQFIAVLDWYNSPDGDRCYDVAADLYRQSPTRRILLVQSRLNRLVEIGAVEPFPTISRRELGRRGVHSEVISAIRTDGHDDWATARAMREWLRDHPEASALMLCGRFRSAALRHVLAKVLGPTLAERVKVQGLPDRRFDETNWWTSRTGIKAFAIAWCRRVHGWYASQAYRPPPFQSADQYERAIRQTLAGASP